MAEIAFTSTITANRVPDFRELLDEMKRDKTGLIERARDVGYYRERMFLQPRSDGDSQLIVFLEFDHTKSAQELIDDVVAYENDFTKWWNPRYIEFLGGPPSIAETVFAWDDDRSGGVTDQVDREER